MSQSYFFSSDKTFDQKAGIFVHHHGSSGNPTVNPSNYEQYIDDEVSLILDMGYKNIETPFTHVTDYSSEFVTVIQYLVDKLLENNISVMLIAQGTQNNSMTESEINKDSENYLSVLTKFIKANASKRLIYEGINEPDSSNWYGQNTMGGYLKALEWNKKLKNVIKLNDSSATFVDAVLDPIYGIPFIKSGNINPTEYAMHSYVKNIGSKGSKIPEQQLLNATYATSYQGNIFAMTEFGIASEYEGTDVEDDWQGIVSADEAAALTVRQMIIQDSLGAPMQYNFILGYLYVFKKYQFFDADKNILPVGVEVKKALSQLSGYKFNKWLVANYSTHNSYIAEYISGSSKKYAFWNSDGSDGDVTIGSKTIFMTSKVQYTNETLYEEIDTFILQTPIGISTIDTSRYTNNQYFTLEIPDVPGYNHNSTTAVKSDSGITSLKNDVYYQISGFKDLVVSNGGVIPYAGTVPCSQLEQGFIVQFTAEQAGNVLTITLNGIEFTYNGKVAVGDVFELSGYEYTKNGISIVNDTNKAYFTLNPYANNSILGSLVGEIKIVGFQNLYA